MREATDEVQHARLVAGDGWTLCAVRWPRRKSATVTVTAETAELCADIAAKATDGMTEPPPPADGLLGQGRKVLVAITTNEDLARLHPAVVRPGRCLARIEVPALPFGEAETWLGTSAGAPADGATLAELYALRDGRDSTADPEPVLAGQYL